MIEPCCAIQKPRGAPPIENWSNSSLKIIPQPNETENQTKSNWNVSVKFARQYWEAEDGEGFIAGNRYYALKVVKISNVNFVN